MNHILSTIQGYGRCHTKIVLEMVRMTEKELEKSVMTTILFNLWFPIDQERQMDQTRTLEDCRHIVSVKQVEGPLRCCSLGPLGP